VPVSTATLILAGAAWAGLLFAAAIVGERASRRFQRIWPAVYALSLAVYCTAWTFYGTASQAVQSGWPLPPTFVGTIALFVFGWPLLMRIVEKAKAQNSTSIADFIASSFGKSSALATIVTGVAVLGMVPYIALQLKAVATSYAMLRTGVGDDLPAWQDITFWVALLMAVFAMVFGTRRAAATEHNGGLVLAMAVESLLKLGALLVVGGFVVFGQFDGPLHMLAETAGAMPSRPTDLGAFAVLAVLGVLAILSLPHQFHIGVVECRDSAHLRTARWLFPVYLLLVTLPIFVFARAGSRLLGDGVPSDLYVLGLPLMDGHGGLALLTFLGGLSAATGMVILASLALSIMIGNHWLAPLTLRRGWMTRGDLRTPVLVQRRFGILLVLGLAYVYSRALTDNEALADIGAVSFSGLAQLAPAVVLAVLRPALPARAVLAGLLAGVAVWSYVLVAPLALRGGTFDALWFSPLVMGPLSNATVLSLAANLLVVGAVARWRPQWGKPDEGGDRLLEESNLRGLALRFLSADRVERLFRVQRDSHRLQDIVEHELAAVVGATSARLLLDAARRRAPAPLETVAALVDEASKQARFKQSLLEAALQNMSQGISVVDSGLRLVAWNQRYADLFEYPADLLQVGMPVETLVRYNARRGLAGPDEPEIEVRKRLAHMQAGTPYVTERRFPDGSVIEILGNPMPGGGFVATFTDVSASRRSEAELRSAAETLEQRVAARTSELEAAKAEAERANQAKSRFLAAVSHDLLQPINAAHLFTHALAQQLRHPEYREPVANIDGALSSSEALLAGILDISRLDAGGLAPRIETFPIDEMMSHLAAEFRVMAESRGLRLRYVPSRLWVESDPQLLRRVLQNFLSNATRYTRRGRVLMGCRRHGAEVSLLVLDTGPGIAAEDRAAIFEEFRSLERGGPGLGLGLAIADRIARLLGHTLELRSEPGRGSAFGIRVARAAPRLIVHPPAEALAPRPQGITVLVLDNDPAVLKAMQALLEGWHCTVLAAGSLSEAERLSAHQAPDLLLLDYHLDGAATGLDLRSRLGDPGAGIPTIVITADHSDTVRALVAAAGCYLLHKPLKPLALKSLMARLAPLKARRSAPG
jgi:Na+/proline symporter/C4-dicarboxylate-specific signal transduction histidine kinase/CheY-like chemotaxis protein